MINVKSKPIFSLLRLGLLPVLLSAGVYLLSHADAGSDSDQGTAAPAQEASGKPSLPMKRLEGSDKAEILKAIEKRQSGNANNSDSTGAPVSPEYPADQQD